MPDKIVTQLDRRWEELAEDNFWTLPPRAPWYCRVWGIRHARVLVSTISEDRRDEAFREQGMYPTGYSRWVIYAIWRGWA